VHTHHRRSVVHVLCSISNDGLDWSRVGILHLHPDLAANVRWAVVGAVLGAAIALLLAALATCLWLRWQRLKKVCPPGSGRGGGTGAVAVRR